MPENASTTRRITISLPAELVQKLDRVAHGNRRTRSNAIARLIELANEPA